MLFETDIDIDWDDSDRLNDIDWEDHVYRTAEYLDCLPHYTRRQFAIRKIMQPQYARQVIRQFAELPLNFYYQRNAVAKTKLESLAEEHGLQANVYSDLASLFSTLERNWISADRAEHLVELITEPVHEAAQALWQFNKLKNLPAEAKGATDLVLHYPNDRPEISTYHWRHINDEVLFLEGKDEYAQAFIEILRMPMHTYNQVLKSVKGPDYSSPLDKYLRRSSIDIIGLINNTSTDELSRYKHPVAHTLLIRPFPL